MERPSGGFATRAVHAARVPQVHQHPVSPPIHLSVTWGTERSAEIAGLLEDDIDGYVYGRYDTPTGTALHAQVAALHGAQAAWATASGTAAIFAALSVARARRPDAPVILADHRLYGGTHALLGRLAAEAGWEVERAATADPTALAAALEPRHGVILVETIANPTMVVADVPGVAEIAERHGAALVVDNTFASPWLFRPLEHGASLVVESATKLLGGHGDVVAGVVAGASELIAEIRGLVIELGANLAPFDAWLVCRGIQTLPLRVERASATAARLADALDRDPRVAHVHHPSLDGHPSHRLARDLFGERGFGTVLAADLGDRSSAEAFADGCSLFVRAASLGSTHSLVVHPASTTHRQLNADGLAAAGIAPGLVRLSVGIEDEDDLLADLRRGLDASARQNGPYADGEG